ncbi:hypothetical protein FACS1894137_01560 [Spirochaetia bacterium]|nr:hypothetical protein FACS1894137_01560 [Spirochaetia bacterium]
MDAKDRETFERMAKAQEEIVAIMGKPESKITRALTVASLSAGVLGAGLFSILQKILEFFGA